MAPLRNLCLNPSVYAGIPSAAQAAPIQNLDLFSGSLILQLYLTQGAPVRA